MFSFLSVEHYFSFFCFFAGCCAYLDIENVLDLTLAERIGVNIGNLLISRAECAENSLSIVNTLVNSGSIDVIVVDSVCTYSSKDIIHCYMFCKSSFFHIS